MKIRTLTLIAIAFLSCKNPNKEKPKKAQIVVNSTELTEKGEVVYWIDTIANGKFLKIYSQPENNWQNLTAEYGNESITRKVNIEKYNKTVSGIQYSEIEWITEKSFALVNGCGTHCTYALIFNVDKENPIMQLIAYYPGIKYANFKTDNPNLYVAVNENFEYEQQSFVAVDTDTQKKDTIVLPEHWDGGTLFNTLAEIEIKESYLTLKHKLENGTIEKLQKELRLK